MIHPMLIRKSEVKWFQQIIVIIDKNDILLTRYPWSIERRRFERVSGNLLDRKLTTEISRTLVWWWQEDDEEHDQAQNGNNDQQRDKYTAPVPFIWRDNDQLLKTKTRYRYLSDQYVTLDYRIILKYFWLYIF